MKICSMVRGAMIRGESNPFWRGGAINHHGRMGLWVPGHPYPNFNKCYVFRSRLVMERTLSLQ